MASNYSSIKAENKGRYGTDIGRIGRMLLANLYAERTHFIFELLQNAEDSMRQRHDWQGSRAVNFTLSGRTLRVVHCGKPFDEPNVRAICNIAETTKDITEIGRFGIGFKSVYAFTDVPEIHSGEEDFAIENYVWPNSVRPINRKDDETVFLLPLKAKDTTAPDEITDALRGLGPQTLLFLREIDEIAWSTEKDHQGLYIRGKPEQIGKNIRQINILGQEENKDNIEEEWLIFSREVKTEEGIKVGYVEIAFAISHDKGSKRIQSVHHSPLVAFFPTVVETHLGFLLQGPYRTTPSRDNVPRHDLWNQRLVVETASLLVESLHSLKDLGFLDTDALHSLPLDRKEFTEGQMFAPLFEAVRSALASESLLPRFDSGHVPASSAKLARTQELRDLFGPTQLGTLFGIDRELPWLSGDISQDRTPELRQYLMRELNITEVTPEAILTRLSKSFLEAQPDEWICRLYEFLNGQPALRWRLSDLPLIRLDDGTHVSAAANDQPQAFLPSEIETAFPTVRRAVCATDVACEFLQSLGLTEPDPVDDVVWNVLPKYQSEVIDASDIDYERDIQRILIAFGTDSKTQREKLLAALRESSFVKAVDGGGAPKRWAKSGDVYLATERLKGLFAGITDVLLVDDSYACLKGEDIRDLLEASGVVRYLRPLADDSLSWEERGKLRAQAGHSETSGQNDRIADWTLAGLNSLLDTLPRLPIEQTARIAGLLWEEIAHLEERRGKSVFTGEYTWTHYGTYRTTFDAAFVRRLNETAWVPDGNGHLQRPELIMFDTLSWKTDPFLLSKIRFKPPVIETLAREAGIEPGVLDLLKKCGVTSVEELKKRLGIKEEPQQPEGGGGMGSETGQDDDGISAPGTSGGRQLGGRSPRIDSGTVGRLFISYVAVRPDEEERDPDRLNQRDRMALEEKSIQFILQQEPHLQRTSTHNPGFDLFETGDDKQTIRWIEVKAMTGSLNDRPVGLSRTQFEYAQEHGEAYWLYIVEQAGSTESARIVRIQDPAGKAQTFTFDHGWLSVADINEENSGHA